MIPLAAVTTTIRDMLGNPVAGAKVYAKLSDIDLYNGEYVYPVEQSFIADMNGLVTMNLFPNALGEKNTVYTVKATDAAGDNTYLNTTCVVPNQVTTLDKIAGTGPVTPQNTYVGSPIAIPFYDQLQKYQSYLKNFNTGVRNYIFPDVSGTVAVLNAALIIGVSAGLLSLTPAGDINARTLQQPAAGITIANANGVAGNPTFSLANDLAALEGIALTGMAARTAGDTWAVRTITGTANQVNVSQGDGVLGNPTLSLPQNIHTGATPTFGNLTINGTIDATGNITTSGGQITAGVVGTSGIQITNSGIVGTMDAQDLVLRRSSSEIARLTADSINISVSNPNLRMNGTSIIARNSVTGVLTFDGAGGGSVFAGNVGLGVTPSTTSLATLEIGQVGQGIMHASGALDVQSNSYYNAGYKYARNGAAALYENNSATPGHHFYTAPSGTAGNAITWAEQVRINHTASANRYITLTGSNGGNPQIASSAGGLTLTAPGGLVAATSANFAVDSTKFLYLDGGGDTAFQEVSADVVSLFTGGTERWRTTAGGYFKASNNASYTSSTGPGHEFSTSDNTGSHAIYIRNQAATATNQFGIQIALSGDPNDSSRSFWDCYGGATLRGQLRSNGGLANFSANNVNLSDRTTKWITGVPGEQRALFRALEIETGGYIGGEDADLHFFTAQQVQTVYPELVTVFDHTTGKLGIKEHGIQMRAYKVIQELDADLIDLRGTVHAYGDRLARVEAHLGLQ